MAPVIPSREEFSTLAGQYRHVRNEERLAHEGGGTRRRLEARRDDLAAEFERLLEEWVPTESLRNAWRDHFYHDGAPPEEPRSEAPLVFAGRSEAGSLVEVRATNGDLEVRIDRAQVERVAARADFAATDAPAELRIDDIVFREVWNASPAALEAARAFAKQGGAPPWSHARELVAEGIVDRTFGFTPRGRRALRYA